MNAESPNTSRRASRPTRTRKFCIVTGCTLAALAAWYLPGDSNEPLVGRYGSGQFLVAILLTLLAATAFLFAYVFRERNTRFRCTTLLVAICATWTTAEFAAYWIDWGRPNPFYNHRNPSVRDPDSTVRYRRPPHLYWKGTAPGDMGPGDPLEQEVEFRTDADGFRNSTQFERTDVAFIGDSFTEAGNVREEQTFVARTGALLNQTVTNFGMAGYGPLEEVAVLEAFALKKDPKCVVWQLCEGNDLSDVVSFLYWQQLANHGTTLTADEVWNRRYSRWQRASPFVRLAKLLSGRREEYRIAAEGDFTLADKSSTSMRFQVLPTEHTDPQYNRIRWDKTREALHKGQALCLDANARLLVVLIPIKLRVFQESVGFKNIPNHVANLPEQSKLSQHVQQACAEAGIEFIDPTQQFRHFARNGELVYFPFDTHLSPVGHQKLAELIAARIGQD